jgi:hypothetical protein
VSAAARTRSFTIGALLVASLIGLALPTFVDALRVFGRHIPQERIEFDYLAGLVLAVIIGVSIRFWPVAAEDRRPLLWIWMAKTVVTLGLMLAYEWNYDLDAYGYYERAVMAEFPRATSSWAAGTTFVARFAWIVKRILPDSYHALKVVFGLVGMLAIYVLYRGVVRYRGMGSHRLLYFVALFPSVLFWSSIVGKDPLQLFGIGLYAYGVLSWRATGRNAYALPIAAGVALAFMIRSWSGPILLFPLLVFAAFGLRQMWMRLVFSALAIVAFGWSVNQFAGKFNIETLRDVQTAAERRSHGWIGGSAQERSTPFTGISGMLRFAPVGAFTALFRPLPGEVRNPFGFVAGLENAFLLGLLLVALVRTRPRAFRDPVLVWAVLLVLTWSFAYSFVSYYNFGAAVRFKLQILPVLLLVLLYLARGAGRVATGRAAVGAVIRPTPVGGAGGQP